MNKTPVQTSESHKMQNVKNSIFLAFIFSCGPQLPAETTGTGSDSSSGAISEISESMSEAIPTTMIETMPQNSDSETDSEGHSSGDSSSGSSETTGKICNPEPCKEKWEKCLFSEECLDGFCAATKSGFPGFCSETCGLTNHCNSNGECIEFTEELSFCALECRIDDDCPKIGPGAGMTCNDLFCVWE